LANPPFCPYSFSLEFFDPSLYRFPVRSRQRGYLADASIADLERFCSQIQAPLLFIQCFVQELILLLCSHSLIILGFPRIWKLFADEPLERHQAGICRVVPILLRPTFWEDAPFSSLQLLPSDARPITRWPDRDEAFQDITTEINRTIKDLLNSLKTKQDWMKVGHALYGLKRYEEALAAFEQAIRLDPNYVSAYYTKGEALRKLERY